MNSVFQVFALSVYLTLEINFTQKITKDIYFEKIFNGIL